MLDLYVYDGADGQFSLYEDEGNNYNYEKGKYSQIDFNYDHTTKTLSLANRKGEFEGMLSQRKFNVVFVNDKNTVGVDSEKKKTTVISYSGKALQVKLK
ncbi:hypothetical protein D3C73_1532180 [compost metagenome]